VTFIVRKSCRVCRAHQISVDYPMSDTYPVTGPLYRNKMRPWERACPRMGISEHPGLMRCAHQTFDNHPIPHAYPVIDPDDRKRMRLWAGLPANRRFGTPRP
jgi:hypothetical protein